MQNNFIFKNIPISYRKMYLYSKILSNKPILYFYKLYFSKKINFYLLKICNTIINICNSTNIFIKNFFIGKGKIIKKINFRAKGRINFIVKKFCNVKINILYG
ncbi:putative ribosomal protein L22 [Candidatus Carsonella ruddii HT isolate Thao2000]|uniref:50S ribosomal protein L22 n=1 Tax=Candidatus Carsonella ruddii HT isolate Thao2000 TaxID=1202539 RepID=J3YQG6_CARRU|nr:uL22 family ribosomal protein [Candidatus Carsonella ruddii]AFP84198.1 putative ribosomal protein L22 [Candidatus Carsonella ruddii HT isolate Thao2000]